MEDKFDIKQAVRLEPWSRMEGKVVMVTGASSGIGLDLCLNLARAGCRLVVAARRLDRLQSLCEQINRFGTGSDRAVAVELDISAEGSAIEPAVRRAWEAFGGIDALVNNAGVRGAVSSVWEISEDEWNNTVQTNLTGTWLVSKYVCLLMRDANKGGSIINISSIAGIDRGQLPGGVAYTTSKTGVNALTKMMAIELGPHKIRVNSISPGIFKSEITEGLVKKDWLKNVNMKIIPLKDSGTSDPALTSLVRYLIDDSSVYVSGNIFIMDAGATLPGVPIFSSL